MKPIHYFPYLMLSALLVGGCAADESAMAPCPDGQVPLAIASAGLQVTQPATRSLVALQPGAQIGVFLRGYTYTDINNARYVCGPAGWSYGSNADAIFLTPQNASVFAYHPFADGAGSQMPLSSGEYQTAKDLSISTPQTVSSVQENAKVSFSLTHVHALLELRLQRDAALKDPCVITEIRVSGKPLRLAATLDIETKAYSQITEGSRLTLDGLNIPLRPGGNYTYQVLLLPVDELASMGTRFGVPDAGLGISLIVDEQEIGTAISLSQIWAIQGNAQYVVGLKVNGTSLEVLSVETKEWDPQEIASGEKPYVPYE